jgi:hypothetical protein
VQVAYQIVVAEISARPEHLRGHIVRFFTNVSLINDAPLSRPHRVDVIQMSERLTYIYSTRMRPADLVAKTRNGLQLTFQA